MKRFILGILVLTNVAVFAQSDLGASFTLGTGIDLYNINDDRIQLENAMMSGFGAGLFYDISAHWRLEFGAQLHYHQLKMDHAEREKYEPLIGSDLIFHKRYFGLHLPLSMNYYFPLNEKHGLKIFSGFEWVYFMGYGGNKMFYNPALTYAARISLMYPSSTASLLGGIGYYYNLNQNKFLEIDLKATIGGGNTEGHYYFSDNVVSAEYQGEVAIQEGTFPGSSNIISANSYLQLNLRYGFNFFDKKSKKATKPGPAYNTVFVEAGGLGGLYSINYDRIIGSSHSPTISKYFGIRVGATYQQDLYFYNKGSSFYLPLSLNLMAGGKRHRVELSPGITVTTGKTAGVEVFYNAFAGYRYQKEEGGLFFRAGYTPIYDPKRISDFGWDKWIHWAGISVGKSF